jgi:hypothetical protein
MPALKRIIENTSAAAVEEKNNGWPSFHRRKRLGYRKEAEWIDLRHIFFIRIVWNNKACRPGISGPTRPGSDEPLQHLS